MEQQETSVNRNTTTKKNKKIEKKDGDQPRYNEKKNIVDFLKSKKGFPLLLEIGKKYKYSDSGDTLGDVDGLIDTFCTWMMSFPVRKNLKISKYDFLKHIEIFCSDKENTEGFNELLAMVQSE